MNAQTHDSSQITPEDVLQDGDDEILVACVDIDDYDEIIVGPITLETFITDNADALEGVIDTIENFRDADPGELVWCGLQRWKRLEAAEFRYDEGAPSLNISILEGVNINGEVTPAMFGILGGTRFQVFEWSDDGLGINIVEPAPEDAVEEFQRKLNDLLQNAQSLCSGIPLGPSRLSDGMFDEEHPPVLENFVEALESNDDITRLDDSSPTACGDITEGDPEVVEDVLREGDAEIVVRRVDADTDPITLLKFIRINSDLDRDILEDYVSTLRGLEPGETARLWFQEWKRLDE